MEQPRPPRGARHVERSRARSRRWIGRAAFEAALIVFGLVGALVVDEWRDTRERDARVRAALTSIHAELQANRTAIARAIANHEDVIGKLRKASETGIVYEGGVISTPLFSDIAWEAARNAAITNDIQFPQLMTLGHAYGGLANYLREREVFLNYLYTNNTMDLRRNPLALAGWLNDMRGHARDVEKRIDEAAAVLKDSERGVEHDGDQ